MRRYKEIARYAVGLLLPLLAHPAAALHGGPALLPTRLESWEQIEWAHAAGPDLEQVVASEAPLLREYGSLRAERATYRQGSNRWQVTAHEMVDRSAAYGAFTLLRTPGTPVELGESAVRLAEGFLFYQGNYFIEVRGEVAPEALQTLARHLRETTPRQASLPTLPAYLPSEGLVAGSDRYLLGPLALARVAPLSPGDWVGFAYGAEVESARYSRGQEQPLLLLINYPTPAIARARLKDFGRLFNLNGVGNPDRPQVYARRTSGLVVLVTDTASFVVAESLLDQVRYELKVSWSDPSDPRPRLSWAKSMLDIFIGTGLLLLFALLSGVAYGVLRVVVKHLAPGRVFERPGTGEDMIVLDLQHESRKSLPNNKMQS